MSITEETLQTAGREVALLLKQTGQRLVLAESCTGGLAAAALTVVPGISDYFCGAAVTYRNETKAGWLAVSRVDLDNPRIGPVSSEVAAQMCIGILQQTPEADLAAISTGHLGPQAPPDQDGVVWLGVMSRNEAAPSLERHLLQASAAEAESLRIARRAEAALLLLSAVSARLRAQL